MSLEAGTVQSKRAIFLAALEIVDDQQRREFLERACGGDFQRRGEIERLLAADDQIATNPLDRILERFEPDATQGEDLGASLEMDLSKHPMIDRYKLLEQIGEGGMGTVFMAQQTAPIKRNVALKLIKPGMDSREVIARFEAERQALAMMDCPHIARVLDAGTTEQGRPYFVMELVRGIPITDYCDENQLPIVDRLRLLIDVCRAVQHAHQKGIIHRDLKPSNVMVTLHDGTPVVKVIDFGVAKALNRELTEQTLFTQFAQMIGTPLYMSPEQAEMSGLDVDTRSDVYSLGVLLYELLTGMTPFDRETLTAKGYDEMRRIIRENEPPRPSQKLSTLAADLLSTAASRRGTDPRQLSLSMRQELDWIVMKAMEKDRTRRYESASALAHEVQRYLDNEPVQACPPTMWYQLRKYARRNRVPMATTAVVTLVLLAGTVVSTSQAYRARDAERLAEVRLIAVDEERRRAEANFQRARTAVDEYFTLVSESTLLDEPGMQPLRKELIESAVRYYETFAARRSNDPQIQLELAATHLRLAQIYHALNRRGDMISSLERGFALVENAIQQQPVESDAYLSLAGFWHGGRFLGGDSQSVADASHAVAVLRQGITIWERFIQAHPETPKFQSDLSKFYDLLRKQHTRLGQQGEALRCMEAAFEVRQELVRRYPADATYKAELSYGYWGLARLYEESDPDRAEKLYRMAIRTQEEADVPVYRGNLAGQHVTFGEILRRRKQLTEAIEEFRKGTSLREQLVEEYPHVSGYQDQLTEAQVLLADALGDAGRAADAEPLLREAIARFASLVEKFPDNMIYQNRLTSIGVSLAKLLQQMGRTDEAIQLLNNPRTAEEHVARGRIYEQKQLYDRALAEYEMAVTLDPTGIEAKNSLRHFLYFSPSGYQDRRRGLEIAKELVELHPEHAGLWSALALSHHHDGQYDEAWDTAQKALALDANNSEAQGVVAECEVRRGNYEAALAAAEKRVTAVPNSILGWGAQAAAFAALKRYEDAIRSYTVYLEILPRASHIYKRRANAHFELGQYDDAIEDLAAAVEIKAQDTSNLTWISPARVTSCPDENFRNRLLELADRTVELTDGLPEAYVTRGLLNATFGEPAQARADFEKAVSSDEMSCYMHYLYAMSCLVDDPAAYRNACRIVLQKFAATNEPNDAHFAAWACVLAPQAVDDYSLAIELAERALKDVPNLSFHQQCLGSVLYRAGRFDDALKYLDEAAVAEAAGRTSPAYGCYFRAMVHHRLGNSADARRLLDRANEHTTQELNDADSPVSWNRRFTLGLLRTEAELLLGEPETDEVMPTDSRPQALRAAPNVSSIQP